MAGGKKKEVLTLEERLQAALVPESEQPYQVPENWCWTRIRNINQYNSCLIDPSKQSDEMFELYSVPSSASDYPEILSGEEIRSVKQSVQKDDVLLCKINPRINRVWKVSKHTDNTLIASSEWIIVRNHGLNSDYLMRYFQSNYFRKFMLSNVSGVGGSLMRAQPKYVQEYPVPIPPLSEQQRIVERIESLFIKLEEAKQKVQDTLDGFETRKAAILYKAFCGALTAQWRKEHGAGREEWENTFIKNICHEIKVGIVIKPSQYYTTEKKGIPAFRSANVREFHIDNFDWVYLNEKGHMQNARSIVHTGDVLIVRSGNPGTACVVTEEFDGYNAIDILIAVPNANKVNSKFLCAYTNSPVCRQLIAKNKRGMALAHFNVGSYSKLPIFLPSVSEQNEIVRILDDLLAKEQQAKEAAEDVLEQIDLIKKSILARAFRGELGTNDSAEESSLELIKQILSETIASDNILKQRTIDRIEVKFVPKTILEVLAGGVRLTPEDLKSETGLQIDEFYTQLKELIDNDKIIETRMDGESYLEAAHEDRQTEN